MQKRRLTQMNTMEATSLINELKTTFDRSQF